MPLPLAPIAGVALRYGTVALAAWAVSRRIGPAHFDQRADEALDDVTEGINARRDANQANVTTGYRRVIRFGKTGPGYDIRVDSITRIRLRRV